MTTCPLKEAKIILPLCAAGHEALDSALRYSFGGFTRSDAVGAWKDHPTEDVYVYTFAANTSVTAMHDIDTIARSILAISGEDCIYVVYPTGQVHYVS